MTTATAPYRKIGKTELYLGDCIKGMNQFIKANSVDVVVTSPPYNIGINYNTYSDKLPADKYLSWMEQVAIAVKRILRDDGSFFINIGNRPTDPLLPFKVVFKIEQHFKLQNVIHWIKSIAIDKKDTGNYPNIQGDIAVGHFKPIVSSRFLSNCHEYVFHFTKTGDKKIDKMAIGVPYQDKTNIGRWKSADRDERDRGNTWFIPYKTIRKFNERPHPSSFPVKLPEMCIKLHGNANTVVDPFLGIGASAIAALKLKNSFFGFEIDRYYMDISISRISSYYHQMSRMKGN